MTGVDKVHYGGELGVEVKASATITLHGVMGYGQYFYNSRPNVTIAQDNDSEVLADDRIVYLKNYHVGGMPMKPSYRANLSARCGKSFPNSIFSWFRYARTDMNSDRVLCVIFPLISLGALLYTMFLMVVYNFDGNST